jgi:hypothetical protein
LRQRWNETRGSIDVLAGDALCLEEIEDLVILVHSVDNGQGAERMILPERMRLQGLIVMKRADNT